MNRRQFLKAVMASSAASIPGAALGRFLEWQAGTPPIVIPALYGWDDSGPVLLPSTVYTTSRTLDAQGRIWVAEGVRYRRMANRQPEGDKIVVLEDTDGDGKEAYKKPFVNGAGDR